MPSAFFSIREKILPGCHLPIPTARRHPQGIQGRKALVENGDSCLILTLPQQDASASTDSLNYHYRLMTDSNPPTLKGTATRVSTGEYKEYLLSLYHDTPRRSRQTC